MAGISDLKGIGNVVEQLALWGALSQVIGSLLAPYMAELQQEAYAKTPDQVLSPPDLAEAVVRNIKDLADAEGEAAKSGIVADRFAAMIALAQDAPGEQQLGAGLLRGVIPEHGAGPDSTSFDQGIREGRVGDKWIPLYRALLTAVLPPADVAHALNRSFLSQADAEHEAAKSGVSPELLQLMRDLAGVSPGPQQLAEALRRGLVTEHGAGPDSTSFDQGIREGNLLDKWTPIIKGLAQIWPTPVDALDAALKGQIPLDQAKPLYERLGGDGQFYQWLLDSRGSAPTPDQAAIMARRGLIPKNGTGPAAVSYEQAFREGPWRDKWSPVFWAASEYWPPPETVRTLLEQGAIDSAQAAKWWAANGLTKDTISAYLAAANYNQLAATRGLTMSAVLDMYYAHQVGKDDAEKLLTLFDVPSDNQALLLAYVDIRRSVAAVGSAVARIQALYIARKISTETARESLIRLKIPGTEIDPMISSWQVAASVNVQNLTAAKIAGALKKGIIKQDEAMADMEALGYTPYDAWVYLSEDIGAALPGKPGRQVAAPLGAVIPGVT